MNTAGPTGARDVVIDRATRTIRFERRLESTPSEVYDAWTRPEHVALWWDPAGAPLVRCDIDLRVGGAFAFASSSHPDMPFAGTYRALVPGSRLEFDSMGATGRVALADDGDATRMIVEITSPTDEHLEQFLRMGVHEGTSRTLDNLVAFAGSRRSR
jgi:uncharacterized protein YndB with AHSA1/START domain